MSNFSSVIKSFPVIASIIPSALLNIGTNPKAVETASLISFLANVFLLVSLLFKYYTIFLISFSNSDLIP